MNIATESGPGRRTSVSVEDPIITADATQLVEWLRDGEVSARAVVEVLLARIDAVNPTVNAITATLADEALAAADAADRARASGTLLGPLHGLPFSVKENLDVAGSATTLGLAALAGATAPLDAPSVANLRAAGAIPLARTNLAELGLRWHTDSDHAGPTVNPWSPGRTPGGSSGGDAVALATGMTPLGLGNDLGGSLRWPAQCNGIAALKPSFGRVAHGTSLPAPEPSIAVQLMAVHGPMARRVRDLRLVLEAVCAPSSRDPWHVDMPFRASADRVVALVTEPEGGATDPAIVTAVERAAQALDAAGWTVESVEPPSIGEAASCWTRLAMATVHRMRPHLPPHSDSMANFLDAMLATSPALDLDGFDEAMAERTRIARLWSEFSDRSALVLMPVFTAQPFVVGDDAGPDGVQRLQESFRASVVANLLGLPAVAVPAGAAGGIPLAVQVMGRRFGEIDCLDAAEVIEAATPSPTPIDPREEPST